MASDNPIISIDPRKNRIRIYKRTIRLFEIPKYVQILVNPQNSIIAIQCLDTRPAHQYHRIQWKKLENRNSYEIYSSFLVDKLKEVCVDWPNHDSYRIIGTYHKKDRVASFDLRAAVPVSAETEEINE